MKIKRISDILSRLVDLTTARTDKINDYTPGSTIRSIYEAVAMELETYYMLQEENVTWAIEHGVLDAFGFTRREAKNAYGYVTLNFYAPLSDDTIYPKGIQFTSTDADYTQVYTLQEAYIIPAGTTSTRVQVFCTQPGTVGNIPANTLNAISGAQTSVSSLTNEDAILTGTDEETLAAVRNRFREFVDTRGRATVKAMDYAARTVEEITGVYVSEGVGLVTVYAHDANGDLPDDVANKVRVVEEYYRPAGIPWKVKPVNKITQDLEVSLIVTDNKIVPDFFTDKLEIYLQNYLNTFSVGQNVVIADLYNRIMAYSPLIYDAKIVEPAENLVVKPDQLIRSGETYVYISGEESEQG